MNSAILTDLKQEKSRNSGPFIFAEFELSHIKSFFKQEGPFHFCKIYVQTLTRPVFLIFRGALASSISSRTEGHYLMVRIRTVIYIFLNGELVKWNGCVPCIKLHFCIVCPQHCDWQTSPGHIHHFFLIWFFHSLILALSLVLKTYKMLLFFVLSR